MNKYKITYEAPPISKVAKIDYIDYRLAQSAESAERLFKLYHPNWIVISVELVDE